VSGDDKENISNFAILIKTADIVRSHTDASLQRLLGLSARVLAREEKLLTQAVYVEWVTVQFEEKPWPEEHARLNLFPVADGKFCVQLLYLEYQENTENALICCIEFRPEFFEQYPLEMIIANTPFKLDRLTESQFAICAQSTLLLEQFQEALSDKEHATPFVKALRQTEIAMQLLRRALECIAIPFTVCPVPACRFLAYETEREKIHDARRFIEQNIDHSFTIKELSRRVAMNECYLKKGFRALTGRGVHEYQQELRIAKAKELLRETGNSVSDVANALGYSSISHFSTAFKKATGMKPCELLK
jgi:AraC-like DNA-binding protein